MNTSIITCKKFIQEGRYKCDSTGNEKLLAETLRWNDAFKLYSSKVYTAEQAEMVLDAVRMVSKKDEGDLASVMVDKSIFENVKTRGGQDVPARGRGRGQYRGQPRHLTLTLALC